MSRERMSRPSSSVPYQWRGDGPASRLGKLISLGSCGASRGANSANIMKTNTSTVPSAANGFLRAATRNEMAVLATVVMLRQQSAVDYWRILGFTAEYSKSVKKLTAT